MARELTIVLNPNARRPRLNPPSLENLRAMLGPAARIHVTSNLEELDRLMAHWSKGSEAAEVTLCFYGGDGSIARGLTSLLRQKGDDFVLPPVLAIRAGTINMLCSILGFRESVDRTLESWNRLDLNALRPIPTIKVEVEGQAPQYGFVFAWGVGYRVLKEYYGKKSSGEAPDIFDAVSAMSSTFAAALQPKASEMPLFRRESIELAVDGRHALGAMCALTVGTIPRVSLGIKPYPLSGSDQPGFSYSANAMSVFKIARHAPTLLFGVGDPIDLERKLGGELFCGSAAHQLDCVLNEGFTMDGEMFELERPTRVRISAGPIVRFWTRSGT